MTGWAGGSLRTRIVTATALISTVGMAVLVALVVAVAQRTTDQELTANLTTRLAAVRSTVSVEAGGLEVDDGDDALYDSLTWVYDAAGRQLQGPRVPLPLRSSVARLSAADTRSAAVAEHWRLLASPIPAGGPRLGSVVVAVDTAPLLQLLQRTSIASGLLGLVAIAGVTALSGLIVHRALVPVARMAEAADAWRHDRLEHRFALGPPRDEITALGAVLDGLLERVGAAIRAEQRLTAELAHELRSPLTVIGGEAELGRTDSQEPAIGDRFDRILRAAVEMTGVVTTLLDAARGTTAVDARAVVGPVIECVLDRFDCDDLDVRVERSDAAVALPAELLERMLAPILDNALRYAGSSIEVRELVGDAVVTVTVTNDGPPVTLPEDELFTPGVRDPASPGAGLGLALARRLAVAAGGDVRLVQSDPPSFALDLPRSTGRSAAESTPAVIIRVAGADSDPADHGPRVP